MTNAFKSLLENEDFVDMTLSAGGKTLRAHKVVLKYKNIYKIKKYISIYNYIREPFKNVLAEFVR